MPTTFEEWQAHAADFNEVVVFGGETAARVPAFAGSTTIASIAQVDNLYILAVVPEPTTWALMLVGLGALCMVSRRQRR